MPKLPLDAALLELADAEAATCRSCKAPTEEGSAYCMPCGSYWADVDAGLWDDPWWDEDRKTAQETRP